MFKRTALILGLLSTILILTFSAVFSGERFTDNRDGTVTDHQLGLLWGKEDTKGNVDWKSAERWVKYTFPYSLPEKIRAGWRLPTLEELQSLYIKGAGYKGYETDCGQIVRITPHIKLSCGWVWSSKFKDISAHVFNFQKGYHYTDRMIHKKAYRALAVKDLK